MAVKRLMKKSDILVLSIHVEGTNLMGQPLLAAHGFYRVNGHFRELKVETPITSIVDFVDAFDSLFKEEDREDGQG